MDEWIILERYPENKVKAVTVDGVTIFTGTIAQLNEQFGQTFEEIPE